MPTAAAAGSSGVDFFEIHVRPLFATRCQKCHGAEKQEMGVRLDRREAFFRGGDDGPVVVPGNPEKSLLIQAVRRTGDVKMPPKEPLSDAEIATLTDWVKSGAPWPEDQVLDPGADAAIKAKQHWAFQPVHEPPSPEVKKTDWAATPIDAFILSKLESAGLTPSPPADRRTLIRRATFDLIGLPPTPEETKAFLADQSPGAFAHLVDRLLQSPHYGERWGRYWLDVARYAVTKGYVFNEDRNYPFAYRYRDWVVQSLNDDLPYDQFLIQQMAADLLPRSDDHNLAALGFLTLGRRFLNNRNDIIDDRLDVIFRGTQALTVTCARCHDHKFDPIPTADYYSMYGVLDCSLEKVVPLAAPTAEYSEGLKAREAALAKETDDRRAEFSKSLRAHAADYLLAVCKPDAKPPAAAKGSRKSGFSQIVVVRWKDYLKSRRDPQNRVWGPLFDLNAADNAEDFAARRDNILAVSDSDKQEPADDANKTNTPFNPLILARLRDHSPNSVEELVKCYAEALDAVDQEWTAALKSAAESNAPTPTKLDDADAEELRKIVYGSDAPTNLSPKDLDGLLPKEATDAIAKRKDEIAKWSTSTAAPPQMMVLNDAETNKKPHVFLRGNQANQGKIVPRQFPAVVAGEERQPFHEGSGRLEMARMIASPANPLTARVIVNRVWMHHFGAPLVGTPSDFGMRSDLPTHPELLDYLASRLVADGWSLKQLHRLIMLSSAYQQASAARPECQSVDFENHLVWRMNRRRLDWESTRDSLLAAGGSLDLTLGGPAIDIFAKPYSKRRTIYGLIERQNLPGVLRTFDFATPDTHSPKRFVTTVPQQALYLMNNPFVVEQARRLAGRPDVAKLPGNSAHRPDVRVGLQPTPRGR